MSSVNFPSGVLTKKMPYGVLSNFFFFVMNLKKIITNITTISILGLGGALPATAQEAGSHVKVGTYNNSTTEGYVHGHGGAYSRQTGGVHIQGGGNSTAGYDSGAPGAHGGYGFSGGYGFQRGAGITGAGSFGLQESTNFGAEGSSWTQLQW